MYQLPAEPGIVSNEEGKDARESHSNSDAKGQTETDMAPDMQDLSRRKYQRSNDSVREPD